MLIKWRSGCTVLTAFCLDKKIYSGGQWHTKERIERTVTTRIKFDIPEEWLNDYLDNTPSLSVAGGMAIEEYGALFTQSIEGSYSNILGLTLFELREALSKLGFFSEGEKRHEYAHQNLQTMEILMKNIQTNFLTLAFASLLVTFQAHAALIMPQLFITKLVNKSSYNLVIVGGQAGNKLILLKEHSSRRLFLCAEISSPFWQRERLHGSISTIYY